MTRAKRFFGTAAMVAGVAVGADPPALADNHAPVAPHDKHMP
ncbi:hypothetical protein ACFVDQ_12695 [Streptomyces sp. NPDC057684]